MAKTWAGSRAFIVADRANADTGPQRVLEPFALGDVALDRDDRDRKTPFMENRDKFVQGLVATSPDRFLYMFRDAFGQPQPEGAAGDWRLTAEVEGRVWCPPNGRNTHEARPQRDSKREQHENTNNRPLSACTNCFQFKEISDGHNVCSLFPPDARRCPGRGIDLHDLFRADLER